MIMLAKQEQRRFLWLSLWLWQQVGLIAAPVACAVFLAGCPTRVPHDPSMMDRLRVRAPKLLRVKKISLAPGVDCPGGFRFDPHRGGCRLAGGNARIQVVHQNRTGRSFVLMAAAYAIDGIRIFDGNDTALFARRYFPVFDGTLRAGNHRLALTLLYRGYGTGIFSYLRGFRFRVRSEKHFLSRPGAVTRVIVVGYERGHARTPLKKRLRVRYRVSTGLGGLVKDI